MEREYDRHRDNAVVCLFIGQLWERFLLGVEVEDGYKSYKS